MVQALSLVRKVKPKAELYIVGEGPEREKIEEMCKTYKLNYFITGYTSHEKALKLISTFDLLVVPSRRTVTTESNIPIKIIESWAFGVPVIATYRKIFENYRAERDLLFCDRTPEDIAKKILHILKNESLKEKLSERGEYLVKNYSYDYIAKKLIQSRVPEME